MPQSRHKCFPLNRFSSSWRDFKKDISLSSIRPVHFLKSEWESFQPEDRVSIKYLVFRGVFCALLVAIILFSLCRNEDMTFYLIYLTYWTMMTQTVYAILFFVDVLIAWIKYTKNPNARRVNPDPEEHGQDTNTNDDAQAPPTTTIATPSDVESTRSPVLMNPRLLKLNYLESIIYFLNPICIIFPFVVTLGFWGFIGNPATESGRRFLEDPHHNELFLPNTLFVHGLNFILATINFFVIAIPIHITHVVYMCGFGAAYLIFSGLYEVSGGTYPPIKDEDGNVVGPGECIYGFLNWKKTPVAATIACIIAIFGSILFFGIAYCFYALRLYIVSRWKPNAYEEHCYDERCYDDPTHDCNHCERGTNHRTHRKKTAPHCGHCETGGNNVKAPASAEKDPSENEEPHTPRTSNTEEAKDEQSESDPNPDKAKDEEVKPDPDPESEKVPSEVLLPAKRSSKKDRGIKLSFNERVSSIPKEPTPGEENAEPEISNLEDPDEAEFEPEDSGDEPVEFPRKPSLKMYPNKPTKPRRRSSTRRYF